MALSVYRLFGPARVCRPTPPLCIAAPNSLCCRLSLVPLGYLMLDLADAGHVCGLPTWPGCVYLCMFCSCYGSVLKFDAQFVVYLSIFMRGDERSRRARLTSPYLHPRCIRQNL